MRLRSSRTATLYYTLNSYSDDFLQAKRPTPCKEEQSGRARTKAACRSTRVSAAEVTKKRSANQVVQVQLQNESSSKVGNVLINLGQCQFGQKKGYGNPLRARLADPSQPDRPSTRHRDGASASCYTRGLGTMYAHDSSLWNRVQQKGHVFGKVACWCGCEGNPARQKTLAGPRGHSGWYSFAGFNGPPKRARAYTAPHCHG